MTAVCLDATATPTAPPQPSSPWHADTRSTWDRVWTYCPSEQRDNALLARERRSTRWAMVVRAIEAVRGSLGGVQTIELGSGRGDLSALLAQRGAQVTLLDASSSALIQASRRFHRLGLGARYERADLLGSLAAYRSRFDVALSSGVIEHFRGADRIRVVRAHYEVLRPGGLAVISVPNAWCAPYRLWKAYLERRGWWPYGMEIPYTRRELGRIARHVGLEIVGLACYGFWHSVGSQVCRTFLRWSPDWHARRSALDDSMGLVLMLFARRPEPRDSADANVGGRGCFAQAEGCRSSGASTGMSRQRRLMQRS